MRYSVRGEVGGVRLTNAVDAIDVNEFVYRATNCVLPSLCVWAHDSEESLGSIGFVVKVQSDRIDRNT